MLKKSVKMIVLLTSGFCLFLSACAPSSSPELSPQQQAARWHSSQGVVYMDQHNYTRGRSEFEQALALDPDYATAHANLGIAFYSLGKYDSARTELLTCLKLNPDHLHANYTLGLIDHAEGGNYEHAYAAFSKVAAADGDDPLVQYYLGRTLSKLGRGDEALMAYGRAISMDPNNLSAHYARAHELRQLGRTDEWRDALAVFDRLSKAGFEGVSTTYQGQGKYAEALAEGHYGYRQNDAAGPITMSTPVPISHMVSMQAIVAGDDDSRIVGTDTEGRLRLYRPDAEGGWQIDSRWVFPDIAVPQAVLVADVDDDGDTDLLASGKTNQLLRQQEGQFMAEGLSISGIARAFGDVDHDGDVDVVSLGSNLQLSVGDGAGHYTDISTTAFDVALAAPAAAVFTDSDNDRDVDILAGGSRMALFANNRDGTLTDVAAARQLIVSSAPLRELIVADIHADGYLDVVEVSDDGLQVYINESGRSYTPVTSVPAASMTSAVAGDLDNDGDLDLVLAGPSGVRVAVSAEGRLRIQDNPVSTTGASRVWVEDLDADGRLDVVAGAAVLHNTTEKVGHWVRIKLDGLNSAPDGYGAKVEVRTATHQQKRELRGQAGHSGVLHVGLGVADSLEFVRILWPSGVRQTELATGGGRTLHFEELNRKGTSCPILYAWDGKGYRFVSDFLGGAIIGYLTGPGQYYTPDTDEYLKIPFLAPKDGRFEVQVGNQLEEILYLDHAKLVAVDHPPGTVLYPNERLLSSPPYPAATPLALRDLRPVIRATDDKSRDVTAELSSIDDVWYTGFGHRPIHGYADQYQLVLELGDLSDWERPVLVGHGWVDYAHSTSNWAAAQRRMSLQSPRLEIAHGQGEWQLVTRDMGTPAGLPKDMVYDLTGAVGSDATDVRVRITTSMALYWDQFMVGQAVGATRSQSTPFTAADLHWRGYPEHTAINGTFAFRYDYDRLQTEASWGTHAGAFTRLGRVEELVDEIDDQFVIMFHGDELTLTTQMDPFAPVPEGWERSYLFYADGFGKDMDFHSAYSLTVEPLPFHGMTRYPYDKTESYPTTPGHVTYRLDYNTRRISGYFE